MSGYTARRTTKRDATQATGKTVELWVIYEDATVVALPVRELFGLLNRSSMERGSAISFRKWTLFGQQRVDRVLCCGPARPSLFQSHARVGACSIISSGADPPISFYTAGAEQKSIHLGQIATVVASKVATAALSAVSMFAKSWGWSENAELTNAVQDEDSAEDEETIANTVPDRLAMTRTLNDPRRIIHSLQLDPTGQLAAATDNLGRVLLIDTHHQVISRMWKGYRNAQCGWIESAEQWPGQASGQPLDPSSFPHATHGLYLVIYSPVRGLVEVWRARYGPKVLSIPVGSNARLFTVPGQQLPSNVVGSRCFVLKQSSQWDVLDLEQIALTEQSRSTVYTYFHAVSPQSCLSYQAHILSLEFEPRRILHFIQSFGCDSMCL